VTTAAGSRWHAASVRTAMAMERVAAWFMVILPLKRNRVPGQKFA
jgi:hypothetical protein